MGNGGRTTESKFYGGDFKFLENLGDSGKPDPNSIHGAHIYLPGPDSLTDHFVFYSPYLQSTARSFADTALRPIYINSLRCAIFSPRTEGWKNDEGGVILFDSASSYNLLISEFLHFGADERPINKVVDYGEKNSFLVGGGWNKIGIGQSVGGKITGGATEGLGLLMRKQTGSTPTSSNTDVMIMYPDEHPIDTGAICPHWFTENNKVLRLCQMPGTTDLKDLLDTMGLLSSHGSATPLNLDGGQLTAGKVGIGLSNPGELLTIQGNSYFHLKIQNDSTGGGYWRIAQTSNSWAAGGGKLVFCPDGASSSSATVTLTNGGNVGINTTSPSEKLDVNGNARFRSVGSASASNVPLYIETSGGSIGRLSTSTSDRRKKKNISQLKEVLGKVTQLRGVSFKWKDSGDEEKHIGMIAQEVEEVYPEFVFTNPTDGFKGIRYAEMVAVLTEAIKEQQKRIDALEKKVLKEEKKKSTR